jgi:hypothetical protein
LTNMERMLLCRSEVVKKMTKFLRYLLLKFSTSGPIQKITGQMMKDGTIDEK